jgi:hypothetical protein
MRTIAKLAILSLLILHTMACATKPATTITGTLAPLEPEAQQKAFAPPNPNWIRVQRFAVPSKDGESFTLTRGERKAVVNSYPAPKWKPAAIGEYRFEEYFLDASSVKQAKVHRSRWFDPLGRLYQETAFDGDEYFVRGYYEDGRVRTYQHFRGGLVTAYACSHDGKETAEIVEGTGRWIEWSRDGTSKESLYLKSRPYLARARSGGRSVSERFYLGIDSWVRTADGQEKLSLGSLNESWTKQPGKPIAVELIEWHLQDGQIARNRIKGDEITARIRQMHPSGLISGRRESEKQRQKLQEQIAILLEADYLKRREDFLRRYEAWAKDAGVQVDLPVDSQP